jgi:tetratricopeptide (TPR) repeat protein
MFADVVGYTALMQEDERRAKLLRDRQREVLEERVAEFDGEIIQYYGDGALCGFQSAIQAVECAVAIQVDLREEPQVPVRIGIHLGDVAFDKAEVYGDGVNIASRIESLAVAGGVLVSGKVADEVKNQPGISTEFLAEVALKNVREPQRVFAVTNEGLVVPGPREVRGWKKAGGRGAGGGRGWLKWVAGAVVVGAVVLGVVDALRKTGVEGPSLEEPTSTPLAPERIAIIPFRHEGSPDDERLGGVMAIQLRSVLASGVFLPVDQTSTPGLVEALQEEGLSGPALWSQVASRTGAELVLHGEIASEPDGDLTVNAYWVEPQNPGAGVLVTEQGRRAEFNVLVRRLAQGLLVARSDADPDLLGDLQSESMDALFAWEEGERQFRAGNYPRAVALLQQAVEADSGLAVAHYRLSQAALWDWDFDLARSAVRDAWDLSGELSPMNRLLLSAWRSFLRSEVSEAETAYRRLQRDHPNNVEVLAGLVSVLVYFNSLQGRSIEEAEPLVRAVLSADPDYGEIRYHALEFAVRGDDPDEFDRWFSGLNPESQQALAFKTMRAVRWGSPSEKEEVIRELRQHDELQTVFAAGRVAAFVQDFPEAEQLGLLLVGPGRNPDYRAGAPALSGSLAFAQGKWEKAKAELERTAEVEPEWALEMQTLFSLFLSAPPFQVVSEEDLRTLRETMESWEPEEGVLPSFRELFGPHALYHQEFRLLLLGLLSARLGDRDGADEWSRLLEEYGYSLETRDLTYSLSQSVDAHSAFAEGSADQANSILAGMIYYPPFEFISVSPFHSRALDRWLRGEVLWELGRPEDALAWYNTLSDGWGEFLFAGPAHLRQAQIYQELPDTALAIEHYNEFIRLWGEADPEFGHLLTDAREALEALEAGNDLPQDPPR